MELLQSMMNTVSGFLWTYVLIGLLIVLGVFFTLRTGAVQIRYFVEMFRLLKHGSTRQGKGEEISAFQALCISTASRVGVGNIAGISIAVVLGGPGAIFWMWVIALIGAATGFIESTLAQIYKVPQKDGGYIGGPAYYINNVLKQPVVAAVFAILISITFALTYNSVQSNTIVLSLKDAFDFDNVYGSATLICIFTTFIIFGGGRRIAVVSGYMVPMMAVAYILMAMVISVLNYDKLFDIFALIIHDAFYPQAAVSGGFASVMMVGIKRGLFSNEAGQGSVPNAAAAASTSHPVKQGLTQAFGVFLDTFFICSSTAVVVLLAGVYEFGGDLTGIELAQASMSVHLGSWASIFMSVMITIFAFSSIIGNYYYGEININYLFHRRWVLNIFRCMVVAMVFVGGVSSLSFVWDLADLFMALLALTNLYAITRLGKYAYIALADYTRQKKLGVKEPEFDSDIIPNQDGIYAWNKEQQTRESMVDKQ